ncbi:hypothetical protein EKK97_10935 [Billgrantia tianxiuensis]|uniref:Uncharacterized protein n=1 Tax=Billgrantia tianxiuensis TaxID=2497861 RepID=A0A6I6ST50_9GAMM|nr:MULTISPECIES: hypothetical protein [Halomonas]MCE8031912.1 hypothetical protein [Halomonas sp. MCCC 1A11057]QHC50013.1 hypothetical protein EKK97_10935 [Halomonas tianxiuensis]
MRQPGFRFLREEISWSRLKQVHQLKVVQTMYVWLFIVPVAAKSLHRIEEFVRITILGHTFELVTTLPFSWHLFYGSALCFVLGNLFFFMYCPQFIRDHATPTEFKDAGKGVQHLYEYALAANLDWDRIRRDANLFNPENEDTPEEKLNRMFWSVQKMVNQHLPSARLAAVTLYGLAALLIAWVILENTQVVLQFAMRQ